MEAQSEVADLENRRVKIAVVSTHVSIKDTNMYLHRNRLNTLTEPVPTKFHVLDLVLLIFFST